MASRDTQPATSVPRPHLPQARLLLGAAAAAVGLFVALHWIVLPGDHLSLDQKNHRLDSIALRDSAARPGARRNTADRLAGAPPASKETPALEARAAKAAPRTTRRPIGPTPGTKRPGTPAAGDLPAGVGDGPAATQTPPADQSSSPPPPPPTPPPPPPPSPISLPQLPELPQVPVPSVPDLPKPQVPSVPNPQVPSLP
jgi:hypothetical protein